VTTKDLFFFPPGSPKWSESKAIFSHDLFINTCRYWRAEAPVRMCTLAHALVMSRPSRIIVLAWDCLLIRRFGECCFLEVSLLFGLGLLKRFDGGFAVFKGRMSVFSNFLSTCTKWHRIWVISGILIVKFKWKSN
jgi:hypothetical protein